MTGIRELPDPPLYSDSLSVGLFSLIQAIVVQSGLDEDLAAAFGEEDARQILDCSHYMLSRGTADMDCYPAWAGEHALFSEEIMEDEEMERFLTRRLSSSSIRKFKKLRAHRSMPDSGTPLYLCLDSIKVNGQVDTAYVVRQDGMPFTYFRCPGRIRSFRKIISFGDRLKRHGASLTLICDRGSLSEKKLRLLDQSGIDYLLVPRDDSKIRDTLISEIESIETMPDRWETTLYEGGPRVYAHIFWSRSRDAAGEIKKERRKLKNFLRSAERSFRPEKLRRTAPHFKLELEEAEAGRVRLTGFSRDEEAIRRLHLKAGMTVMITRQEMTADRCREEYSKRNFAEESLADLKNDPGRVFGKEAPKGKGLIWFVAFILWAYLDDWDFPVWEIIHEMEDIKAQRNPRTGERERRYRFTEKQEKILECAGLGPDQIDSLIRDLSV